MGFSDTVGGSISCRDYDLQDAKVAVPIIFQFNSPVWPLLETRQILEDDLHTKNLTKPSHCGYYANYGITNKAD